MEASPAPCKASAPINMPRYLDVGGANEAKLAELDQTMQRASVAEVELDFQSICIETTFDSEIVKVNVIMCLCPQRRVIIDALK
eukprot:818210-Pyramimonas_sp.AAC.1